MRTYRRKCLFYVHLIKLQLLVHLVSGNERRCAVNKLPFYMKGHVCLFF